MRDFLKTAWIDNLAKAYWTDTFHHYQKAYSELESSSIGEDREAAILTVPPAALPELTRTWTSKGWFFYILSATPAGIPYANGNNPVVGNEPVNLRVLVSTEEVYDIQDNLLIGRLLGYPACCARHFNKWWGKITDYSFLCKEDRAITENDIIFRHFGVRFVRHLPCHPNCNGSKIIAERMFNKLMETSPSATIAVGKFMVGGTEISRLHGVAEVVNPWLKFAYNSDYTASKESFALTGESMVKFNDYEWKDNGFNSLQAQDRAHDPIILAFLKVMKYVTTPYPHIADYGCGNGALLEKLNVLLPNTMVYGVELKEPALRKAEARLPMGRFYLGNLFTQSFPCKFDVAMISVKRLHETPGQAKKFLEHERANSVHTIFYDYDNLGCLNVLKKYYVTQEPVATFKNSMCEAVAIRW